MDEVGRECAQAGGMDPPALPDRHAFLHPEQGLAGSKVGEDEAGPAGIAGTGGEEFEEGWPSLFGEAEWGGGSAQH